MTPLRDAPSLAALLPYHSFDPAGVFVLRDGSIGMAWSLSPAETEAMEPSQLGALAGRMEGVLKLLPVGSAAQFLVSVRRNAAPRLESWRAATTSEGLTADLALSRVASLSALKLRHEGAPLAVRSFETTFTLRLFPSWPRPIRLSEETARKEFEAAFALHRRRILESAASLESLLQQGGFRADRFDADRLIASVGRILNPARPTSPLPDRDDRLIADRIAFSHAAVDAAIDLGGEPYRVLSCSEVPRETWTGMIQREAAPIDQMEEGLYVLNIESRDPESVRRSLAAKKRLAFCQMSSGDSKADVSAIKSEVDGVLTDMYADGARPYGVRIHLLLRGEGAPVVNAFSRVGVELVEEDALAGTLFLQSLPLNYDPANDRALKRGRVLMGANLAHLLPVYGSFQGTPSPDLLLMNRRGEPITFSFFDSEVAPHGVIAGVSGSGKSVLANALIGSVVRRGASVFVLDRGNSYRKLAGLLGGSYLAFDPVHPRSINPCGSGLDEEKQLFLTDIVAEMCTQGQRELSVKERALVGRAITRAFAAAGRREVLLSDLQGELLRDPEPGARDLGICLEAFCGEGPYAGFFDRPCALDLDAPLTVFELGDVAKRRDVAGVILMALIHNITRFAALHLERAKYLLVDEAWTLLRSANTAQFLEDVLRTYRKLNASAVMITQQVGDFEGRTGEAIRANAPNRIFLRQTPETVQAMERLLDLAPAEKKLLAGLVTVKGRFSEMLVSTPSTKGVARLAPDPLLYWIATSDPADNSELQVLVERHRAAGSADPAREAVREAATRWPNGIRQAKEQGHGFAL